MYRGVLLVLASIIAVQAQLPGLGKCPNPPVQKDFNVSRYTGKWFEIERYKLVFFEIGSKCVQATYTLKEDKHLRVDNKGINKWTGKVNEVIGDAAATNASEPAKLSVQFGMGHPGPYWVLATDYTTYSVVYCCVNVDGFVHADITWILSRKRTLPKDVLDKLHYDLYLLGVRVKSLAKTDQTDC